MGDFDLAKFSYFPLDRERNEFRLLRLCASPDPEAPLMCRLEHASLDKDILYAALSYTWGTSIRTESINLDGFGFPVTHNLHGALRTLRNQDTDRYLWIDAICINQDDIPERSYEVLRMVHIYQKAYRVVAWLGDASDDSGLALEHLRNLSYDWHIDHEKSIFARTIRGISLITSYTILFLGSVVGVARARMFMTAWTIGSYMTHRRWGGAGSRRLISWPLKLVTYGSIVEIGVSVIRVYRALVRKLYDGRSLPDDATVKALESLFARSWFRRVWIIQEVGVAKDIIVACGKDFIHWEDMGKACRQIDSLVARTSVRNPYTDTHFRQFMSTQNALDISNLNTEQLHRKRNLLSLLSRFNHFQATDERDKLYGLLGLATEFQSDQIMSPEEEKAILVPDYDKSLTAVYSELVPFMVGRTGRLDILRLCEGMRRIEGLPSWAPNLTCTASRATERLPWQLKPEDFPGDPSPSTPIARFSEDLKTMTVRGLIIAELVGEVEVEYATHNAAGVDQLGATWTWIRYGMAPFMWSFKSGFFTFCMKTFVKFVPEAKEGMAPYIEMTDRMMKDFAAQTTGPVDGYETPSPIFGGNMFQLPHPLDREPRNLAKVDWKPTLKRISVDPRYIRTYAPDPATGDLICFFIGGGDPYILRRIDDHYMLVGPANLGGFCPMLWIDCMREYEEGTLQLQEFEIQ